VPEVAPEPEEREKVQHWDRRSGAHEACDAAPCRTRLNHMCEAGTVEAPHACPAKQTPRADSCGHTRTFQEPTPTSPRSPVFSDVQRGTSPRTRTPPRASSPGALTFSWWDLTRQAPQVAPALPTGVSGGEGGAVDDSHRRLRMQLGVLSREAERSLSRHGAEEELMAKSDSSNRGGRAGHVPRNMDTKLRTNAWSRTEVAALHAPYSSREHSERLTPWPGMSPGAKAFRQTIEDGLVAHKPSEPLVQVIFDPRKPARVASEPSFCSTRAEAHVLDSHDHHPPFPVSDALHRCGSALAWTDEPIPPTEHDVHDVTTPEEFSMSVNDSHANWGSQGPAIVWTGASIESRAAQALPSSDQIWHGNGQCALAPAIQARKAEIVEIANTPCQFKDQTQQNDRHDEDSSRVESLEIKCHDLELQLQSARRIEMVLRQELLGAQLANLPRAEHSPSPSPGAAALVSAAASSSSVLAAAAEEAQRRLSEVRAPSCHRIPATEST